MPANQSSGALERYRAPPRFGKRIVALVCCSDSSDHARIFPICDTPSSLDALHHRDSRAWRSTWRFQVRITRSFEEIERRSSSLLGSATCRRINPRCRRWVRTRRMHLRRRTTYVTRKELDISLDGKARLRERHTSSKKSQPPGRRPELNAAIPFGGFGIDRRDRRKDAKTNTGGIPPSRGERVVRATRGQSASCWSMCSRALEGERPVQRLNARWKLET